MAVAALLAVHPIYALLRPDSLTGTRQLVEARGLPWNQGLVWGICLAQILCSLALLANRAVLPATVGYLLVLAARIGLTNQTTWYALGGASVDGNPGIEFTVLFALCLVGTLWGQRRSAQQGLDVIRVGSALVLLMHPLHGVLDPAGLRGFGHGLESLGFPFGLFLVWTTKLHQIGSSMALLARRLVVPACLGHMFVLSMGIWISHAPRWFVVGPGENGMEYSLLFIACFASLLLAHWPQRAGAEGAEASALSAAVTS
jgi:putative oxidoreductase